MNKQALAIILSKLKTFSESNLSLEQYQTPSDLASDVLWSAFMQGDIKGKKVADLGCGNGIFGIGALLLGAKEVYFVDKDQAMIELAKTNISGIKTPLGKTFSNVSFMNLEISFFSTPVDVVFQNPPFGVQEAGADRPFLDKAMELSLSLYSLHKIESKEFLEQFAKDKGFKITDAWVFDFPLKASMEFHRRKIERIKVGCWRLEKTEK